MTQRPLRQLLRPARSSRLARPPRSLLASTAALLLLLAASTGCAAMNMKEAGAAAPDPMPGMGGMMGPSTTADVETSKKSPGFFGSRDEMAPMAPMPYPVAGKASPSPPPPPPPPPPGDQPLLPPEQNEPGGPAARAGAGAERPDSVVIYTGDLTLAVFEVQKSIEAVAAIAKRQGGFLARRDDQSITVRVPSRHFDQTIRELEGVGDVLHRNVTAEDVSEEFHDLQIQLRNLMAMRERLVVLLAKAAKVEEAIAVERELGRVAGEIDRIQGRLKFLEDRAQLSTITVRLEPRAPSTVDKGPFQVPLPWLGNLGIDRLLRL